MNEVIGITGLDELRATLVTIKDRGVKKAVKAGINAGLQQGVSALRSAVNSSPASAELKAAARKTIGKSLRFYDGNYIGKFGFGVGAAAKAKQVAKAKAKHDTSGGGGVGISAANIHWAVLGTNDRTLKRPVAVAFPNEPNEANKTATRFRTVTSTGAMPASLAGLVAQASESAAPQMTTAAAAKISQVLLSEALKK